MVVGSRVLAAGSKAVEEPERHTDLVGSFRSLGSFHSLGNLDYLDNLDYLGFGKQLPRSRSLLRPLPAADPPLGQLRQGPAQPIVVMSVLFSSLLLLKFR